MTDTSQGDGFDPSDGNQTNFIIFKIKVGQLELTLSKVVKAVAFHSFLIRERNYTDRKSAMRPHTCSRLEHIDFKDALI
jgi:hypothetical protein